MTSQSLDRHKLLGVAPILVAGAVVLPMAAVLGGSAAAGIAACGVIATFAIFVIAESIAKLSRVERPVERMLLTMGVRGLLAAAALIAGVATSGAEPKVIALVALPLYLSLLAGEAIVAATVRADGQLSHGGERN